MNPLYPALHIGRDPQATRLRLPDVHAAGTRWVSDAAGSDGNPGFASRKYLRARMADDCRGLQALCLANHLSRSVGDPPGLALS